jgi:hypothetical protein
MHLLLLSLWLDRTALQKAAHAARREAGCHFLRLSYHRAMPSPTIEETARLKFICLERRRRLRIGRCQADCPVQYLIFVLTTLTTECRHRLSSQFICPLACLRDRTHPSAG